MFRLDPNLPSEAYTTYGIISPKSTHTRVGTCDEVTSVCDQRDALGARICVEQHCGASAHGWVTKVDVGTDIGVQRARYIIDHSERRWTSKQDGGLVTFTFHAGQRCFAEHRISLQREPLFTMKPGDYRTYARPRTVGTEQWLDTFGNNQRRIRRTTG
jgi:hypothetical protein